MSASSSAVGSAVTLLEFMPLEEGDLAKIKRQLAQACRGIGKASIRIDAFQMLTAPQISVYLPVTLDNEAFAALRGDLEERLDSLIVSPLSLARLDPRLIVDGASAGQAAPFRYVVHTNVDAGGGAELERWYDTEHMPGLAAVPGTVLAQRMIYRDGSAPYFACYDLIDPDVLGSEPWLKVRGTPWSDRVRPTFRDTRRFMSRRLAWPPL